MVIRRGDIYYADLSDGIGHEQRGIRPVLVIQNNMGNRRSPMVIIASITSKKGQKQLPTHVQMTLPPKGMLDTSIILCEQLRTIDKTRLMGYKGKLCAEMMSQVDLALSVSLGLF